MAVTANLRRDARIDVRVPVALVRGKAAVPHQTLDVSFRGICLECKDPPALRSLVRLKVTIPSRTLEVHAMVVHVMPASDGQQAAAGLQFWGLSGSERQAWEDFVRALVTMRREAAKKAAAAHPANTEMNTPSGIRTVGLVPGRIQSK